MGQNTDDYKIEFDAVAGGPAILGIPVEEALAAAVLFGDGEEALRINDKLVTYETARARDNMIDDVSGQILAMPAP